MKATILDGFLQFSETAENIRNAIAHELENKCSVESFILRDMKIVHCTGCFGCWNKTPGMCVMKDDSAKIAYAIVNSDLLIFLTPITFGGYSSELKKALDRIICVILPFFTTINHETHHKARYAKYPKLMGIGVMPEKDAESEQIFSALICRNAINLHAPAHVAGILRLNQSMNEHRENIRTYCQTLTEAK
jgi:multimeric flavodoxin WrbA